MMYRIFFVVLFSFSAASSFAQLREIPQAVKEAFMAQYAGAESPEYVDKVINVEVQFEQDGHKKTATYNNKGMWRETEQEWSFDQLSDEIKEGFAKSKYSGDEWDVVETKIITRPGNKTFYRVKVQKNEVQKKYLFYNATGKLESEALTI